MLTGSAAQTMLLHWVKDLTCSAGVKSFGHVI